MEGRQSDRPFSSKEVGDEDWKTPEEDDNVLQNFRGGLDRTGTRRRGGWAVRS